MMGDLQYKISDLAELIEADVHGDASIVIGGLAPITSAVAGQLTFLGGKPYRDYLPATKASAVILTESDVANCPCVALVVKNPELAFAKIARQFAYKPVLKPGIHPSAVIGNHVSIASDATVMANVVIGDNCSIGKGCTLHPNVTLYHGCVLGERVTVHSNTVIGADGFGLAQDNGKWVSIPQLGRVVIGNDVDIGANTCIDRGALQDTVIEDGVKIDNLVQIAHNVHIGAHTAVAGNVGIAGSATIGKHCLIGGGACINGHISLCDQVIITGMAMIVSSIDKPGVYSSGTGMQNNRDWHRSVYYFQQLPKLAKRLKKLERETND